MNFKTVTAHQSLSLFVKSIMVFEEAETEANTILPFFADGYPGLMFQETQNGLWVQPHNKKMPRAFLYGQTIKPIELHIKGSYKLIAFQLFPYALKTFFDITAKELNDGCYDLLQIESWHSFEDKINVAKSTNRQIEAVSQFLLNIVNNRIQKLDNVVRHSIQIILDKKAQISIRQLCNSLHVTQRTFERRFLKEVGVTSSQFLQITKFQQSLQQLNYKDYTKLSDIVYENGFSDQSNFIRVFKAFTGKTPTTFLRKAQ